MTWSVDPCEFEPGEFHNIAVWETRTGTRLRSFSFDISTLEKKEEEQVEDVLMRPEPKSPVQIVKAAWPIFKWSYDDKYLARISPQGISVYETPSMGLLDKTSIKVRFRFQHLNTLYVSVCLFVCVGFRRASYRLES